MGIHRRHTPDTPPAYPRPVLQTHAYKHYCCRSSSCEHTPPGSQMAHCHPAHPGSSRPALSCHTTVDHIPQRHALDIALRISSPAVKNRQPAIRPPKWPCILPRQTCFRLLCCDKVRRLACCQCRERHTARSHPSASPSCSSPRQCKSTRPAQSLILATMLCVCLT